MENKITNQIIEENSDKVDIEGKSTSTAKDGETDRLPCGMHPNACPCGDGACADYIP